MISKILSLYALLASIYLIIGFALSIAKSASAKPLPGEPKGAFRILTLNILALTALSFFFPPLSWLLPSFLWSLLKPSIGL